MAKDGPYHKQEKWDIQRRGGLQYFPDSYIEYVFPFGVPEPLKADAKSGTHIILS